MKGRHKGVTLVFIVMTLLSLFAIAISAIAEDEMKVITDIEGDIKKIDPIIIIPQNKFTGTWVNVDPEANGMIEFKITGIGSALKFNGYGACYPTPCDWGTAPVILYSDSISSTDYTKATIDYDFGFKKTRISLTMLNSNLVLANDFSEFTDGSGRNNYFSENYFVKSGSICDSNEKSLAAPDGLTRIDSYPCEIQWNDNSDNEDGFNIYIGHSCYENCKDIAEWNQVVSVGKDVTGYTWERSCCDVAECSCVLVRAYNENGESSNSNIIQLAPLC